MTRCGLIALVGAPNVGKSSLINALVGARVGIVSSKPNTTRLLVRGVITVGENQFVFVDTPGLNTSKTGLDKLLVHNARAALADADVIAVVIDAHKGFDARAKELMELHKSSPQKGQTMVLVLNKIDTVQPRSKLLALMEQASTAGVFTEVFAISALKDTPEKGGLKDVLPRLARYVPAGPWLFPVGQTTDMPQNLRLAELTREQAMRHLSEELPYGVAVITDSMDVAPDGVLEVHQRVLVARENHQGMVVGKGGSMLERIGTAARLAMQDVLDKKVRLKLLVRTEAGWAERQALLHDVGLERL
jgi:GTPase